jgi:hypothetical protein
LKNKIFTPHFSKKLNFLITKDNVPAGEKKYEEKKICHP